jgi:hypothetical protein
VQDGLSYSSHQKWINGPTNCMSPDFGQGELKARRKLPSGSISGHSIQRFGGRLVLATSAVCLALGLIGLALSFSLPIYVTSWLVHGASMRPKWPLNPRRRSLANGEALAIVVGRYA